MWCSDTADFFFLIKINQVCLPCIYFLPFLVLQEPFHILKVELKRFEFFFFFFPEILES